MSAIHVALISAHPRESDARAGIARDLDSPTLGDYRGVWRTPMGTIVHLFSDLATDELNRNGLTLVSSALPGDADASFLLARGALGH
jgi:hypothetical protein